MIWPTSLALLLLITGSCHGVPAPKNRMSSSRVQERDGGFMEFGDIPGKLRGVCSTVLNVESVLTTFPLSLVSNVVMTIPLPIPNPLILDPFRLYELAVSSTNAFQNAINSMTGEGPQAPPAASRKRDLSYMMRSYEIDGVQRQLDGLKEKMYTAFRPFNFQTRSAITEREAEDPGKPGYLLNFRNCLDIVEYFCEMVDTVESFFKTSFISFLRLYRIPLPIPNGDPINFIKALDIYDIEGAIDNLRNTVSSWFGGVVVTTEAPAGFWGNLFGGSAAEVTTAAPGFLQQAANSVGNVFGSIFSMFGGGSSSNTPPESAPAHVQNDEVMEAPPQPQVMVAVAKPVPVKTTTIPPASLSGNVLGVNMDWLFGNDNASPVLPASKTATTTVASATAKVVVSATTTKAPVASFFDSLFGSAAVVATTTKPSPSPGPASTTKITTTTSSIAAKAAAVPANPATATKLTAANSTASAITTTVKSNLLGWSFW